MPIKFARHSPVRELSNDLVLLLRGCNRRELLVQPADHWRFNATVPGADVLPLFPEFVYDLLCRQSAKLSKLPVGRTTGPSIRGLYCWYRRHAEHAYGHPRESTHNRSGRCRDTSARASRSACDPSATTVTQDHFAHAQVGNILVKVNELQDQESKPYPPDGNTVLLWGNCPLPRSQPVLSHIHTSINLRPIDSQS